ncbi:hypothetical protein L0668_17420 [Paraglaciecola aquimarina]|uniref:Sel1 repeat family protein n=1 Tax=Paraglaciecola algarum TaxID=3050085 RepID=A0ABS9DAH7_9ALTE|nr:hypothetical protein [Paraglaciecola sp. G1-23]MCF2949903.1 hypothetical protein [Paraglaciecola sp. G1-23]
MKFFWFIPVFILLFLVKVSLEQLDNAKREIDARAFWAQSQESDGENTDTFISLAIEKLTYSQLFDKKTIFHPALLGHLYRELADNQSDVGKAQEYYRQAKLNYLNELKINPTESIIWASLARVKRDLQEVDEEYVSYLVNANHYGQHDPITHIELVQLGAEVIIKDYPLSSTLKSIFLHHLIFGITHPKSMQTIMQDINKDDSARNEFCSWIKDNKSASKKLKCT